MRWLHLAVALCGPLLLSLSASDALSAETETPQWTDPADNPLLGTWELTEESETGLYDPGDHHCANGMVFETTQQTVIQNNASFVGEAFYIPHNGFIVVRGANPLTEGAVPLLNYRMIDHDHMARVDALLCKYQRANQSQPPAPPPSDGCPSPEEMEQMQQQQLTVDQAMTIIRCRK